MVHNVFKARCTLDLRWRDAEIVQARGPLLANIGGTFGKDSYPEEIVSWIDDITVRKDWTTLANAEAWVDTIEARLQAAMAILRQLFQQYPTNFDQRTRTV